MSKPILYSLQHCPYAMRARMGLLMSRQDVLLRAVVTKNKPAEMLQLSSKGTIPVLLLADGTVIDESLDIMLWTLNKSDPENLLYGEHPEILSEMLDLIKIYDGEFRTVLSAYKNAKRYHLESEISFRKGCEVFIQKLETYLSQHEFIMGERLSLMDLAVLPFIRQFAHVDRKWFRETDYTHLRKWLSKLMQSLLFTKTMKKYPLWEDCHEEFLLSWDKL